MRTKVYDLPTRLFHWLFAGLFLSAFVIAKLMDDDSPVYPSHMLAGLLLGSVVCLRILWGLVGSRYARFGSFALSPMDLVRYFRGIVSGSSERFDGHNPASSWAALIMMALALGLGVTGYLMTSGGNKEALEDIHELFANAFILVVVLHVAGIVLHTLRHRDNLPLAMISGKKSDVPDASGIQKSHRGVAFVFLALVATFAVYLGRNYDPRSQKLTLFGTPMSLGESEGSEESESGEAQEGSNEREVGDDD